MDKTTAPGLVVALGALMVAVILEGGALASLINVPAALIVFGGSLGVALTSSPLHVLASIPKFLPKAFQTKADDPQALVETFVRLSDKARREGLLALEHEADQLDAFTRKGVQLVVDGSDPALVREVLESEIAAMQRRHRQNYSLLEALGGYAPTLGIIGTVMGLVNVLGHLEDPSELGHLIASAFIATLYGVASANLVWLPLGQKLKHKSGEEAWRRELAIEGILSVQAGDNPRVVRQKLEAQLPPGHRAPRGATAASGRPAEQPAVAGG
jgi:chemotaxis protein MotA